MTRFPSGRWPRPTREHLFSVSVVIAAFAIAYLSTIRTRPLFAPDSRYYAAMSLWISGDSKDSAAREVAAHSAKAGWESPGPDILFGWGLVQPRVVYPTLSAPFVKLFGIDGLAIVPGIATGLLIALVAVLLARRWGNLVAVATVVLVCSSPLLFFYFSAMLTESLTALWSAVLLALVWRHQRNPSGLLVISMILVTVISGFTRQATLIPAGAFVSAWVCALVLRQNHRDWRAPALAVGVTAVAVQLLQTWWFPTFSQANQFKTKTGADTLGEAVARAPELAWHILVTDIQFMARSDRALLMLLALALLSMVVLWRRPESHLLLGALAAYELYNVTNGTPTAFRYGTPGLIFVACSVAALLAATASSLQRQTASAPEAGAAGPMPPNDEQTSRIDRPASS